MDDESGDDDRDELSFNPKLLCQLLLTRLSSPLSLNVVWFSTFKLMVAMGQTDGQMNRQSVTYLSY